MLDLSAFFTPLCILYIFDFNWLVMQNKMVYFFQIWKTCQTTATNARRTDGVEMGEWSRSIFSKFSVSITIYVDKLVLVVRWWDQDLVQFPGTRLWMISSRFSLKPGGSLLFRLLCTVFYNNVVFDIYISALVYLRSDMVCFVLYVLLMCSDVLLLLVPEIDFPANSPCNSLLTFWSMFGFKISTVSWKDEEQ